jgi:hypothetical protein
VQQFLQAFLPLQRPPNYQLVADELATRFAFHRHRKSVAAYARRHFPLLVSVPAPLPKPRRRWQRARVGELWQHDSSIHCLLDLHLALHLGRRVNADHQVDFLGRSWPVSATARKTVTIIHHPQSQFWVVPQPPKPPQNRWPDILGKFSL